MDIAMTVVDGLRQIYELQGAIRRQRRVNRKTYLRMMEIYVELQVSETLRWDPTLQRTETIERFSAAVGTFAAYLKKYHDMHWHGRMFKQARMEDERLKIIDEIDRLLKMLNLASNLAVINGQEVAATNAARLFDKLDRMHGDIKYTHEQIHEALLSDKHQIMLMRTKKMPEPEPVVPQKPILKKYSVVLERSLLERSGRDDSMYEEKEGIESKRGAPEIDLEVDQIIEDEEKSPVPEREMKRDIMATGVVDQATPQQKEEALLDLLRKCITNSNRKQVYKTKGIPVLKSLVRNSESFFTQLYALHCLSWFTFSYSKVRESEFVELQSCVRQPTHPEILSLLHELQHEDDDVKEVAVLQCSCLATRGDGDALRRVGVLPPVIEQLKNGTSNQKLWAAETLVTLAGEDDDENSEAIMRGGAIPPLVALLRSGTDMQKQEAAYALGNLANNEMNRAKITREGAIPPMVAFVKAVTDAQNQWAVYALGFLSVNNEENRVLIAQEGAIPPLVALLRTGTRAQKQWAAYTLGNLSHNDANRVKITQEGAIGLLVELLRTGTAMIKQRAAFALGNLACDSDDTADFDEAILPLVELVRSGSESQKEDAAYTLGNLACSNDERRTEIGRKGAIPPLVKLLQKGSDDQKEWAAFALRYLAYDNAVNRVNIVNEGAMPLLVGMTEDGTDEQKEQAAHALKHLVAKDEADPQGFTPDRLMKYLRTGAQNANMTAQSTYGTVREKVVPIFHKLASPTQNQEVANLKAENKPDGAPGA
ncbi:hypothetical protein PHMEG_0007388 [Phytophthora megakarya]|uniref:Uncharacterized protein n=1 Tax=Phytophthora megakarya TaxID=4795 RepID=A0A225WLE8_9STRA|nr:hypothetical protein PHMEG_0007388 [Phytophthora megakarya]